MPTPSKPLAPRYIAVPFNSGGTVLPIPTPTITPTVVSSSQINLRINYAGPPGATTYAFERSTSGAGPFVPIASGTSATFNNTGLTTSTTYFFRGRVQVTDGRFSSYTPIVSATTLSLSLAAPTNVVANGSSTTTTTTSWTAVTNATGYKVYRDGVFVATDSASPFLDSGLSPSTTYSYQVSATNGTTESPLSIADPATTLAPTVGAIKQISGHWWYLDQNRNFDDQFARMQLINGRVPHCKGFQLLWRWANLENPNVPGDYSGNWAAPGTAGFQLVHRFADYAASVGKMIHVNIFTYGGAIGGPVGSVSPTFPDDMAPHYLSGSAYGPNTATTDGVIGGCWVNSYPNTASNVRAFVRFWVPAVRDRLVALSGAMAAEFDTHSGFGVWSHHSETTMPPIGGYSVAAEKAVELGVNGMLATMRNQWPHTALRLWCNFYGNSADDMSVFINEAVKYKWHVGGPDTLNDDFDIHDAGSGTRRITSDFVWQGRNTDNTVNPAYTNWVNKGSFGADVEPLDLDNSHDDARNDHHLMHANKCGAHCLWWFDLRYDGTGKTPTINRTDTPSPNLLDWVESCARGGNVAVNGVTAGIALTNANAYPPTW